jgi:CheY-like chemotaxis protein
LEGQQARVYFAVIDTGIGLDLEEQALLFKAFHQADTTTTRLYGGSGLGLAICKELVEAMGGEIIIDSHKDLGACFSFSVNLELSASASASARLYKFPGLRNTRVLVVEDNEIIQEFIPDIMSYEGVQVDLANNGEEALALLAVNDYAAVLMDLQMPIMDGFVATSRIRQDSRFDKLPIIAMTGNVFDQERQRCLDCGMNDFISKPVEWEQAFETLERWIVDPQGQSFASLGCQAKAV